EEEEEEVKLKDLQEDTSKGKVRGSLFFKYLLSGGNFCFVTLVLLLFILAQAAASGVDYFVSFWVNVEEARNVTTVNSTVIAKTSSHLSTDTSLQIYGGLIASLFVFALTRSILFY